MREGRVQIAVRLDVCNFSDPASRLKKTLSLPCLPERFLGGCVVMCAKPRSHCAFSHKRRKTLSGQTTLCLEIRTSPRGPWFALG